MMVAIDALQDPLARMIRLRGQNFPTAGARRPRRSADQLTRAVTRANSLSGLLDCALTASLTQTTVRQNDDMRTISAWVAMAAVPTMVAGIYGMNFRHMPELEWDARLPAVVRSHGDRRDPAAPAVQEERLALRSSVRPMADITIRKVKFEFPDELDDVLPGDDRVAEAYLVAFSLTMPYLEPYLIRTYRSILDDITDPALAEDVRNFIGQEAQHFQNHRRVNEMIKGQLGTSVPLNSSGGGPSRRRSTAPSTPTSPVASTSCTPRDSRR